MDKSSPDTKASNEIAAIAGELLEKLSFSEAKVEAQVKDETVTLEINVEGEAGILIGYHGEILEAFQLILSLIAYRRQGSWQKIQVNINDYLGQRREQLEAMASKIAEEVSQTKKSQVLPYLSANERRMVHEFLSGSDQVSSESIGEGRQRRLVISPK
ncbi:hypothetical protein A2160_04885 [Candidatus Beckwithbacteria bacterium RBG_13_42_9]|uniref:R3H domain-containing protein n=1 Tax=Candidatus Beckwithbacteria bacterium RBG_13_42_9 TaxID=1797457 RepID=A0A1F5E627_9BACT|nr:MAG: hypothetical protein A2160_04885 [Candidatus Beckwithbacteria bacterium RBG_13_42_9]